MDASVKQKSAGKDLEIKGAGIQSLEKGLKVLTAIQHAGRAMRLNDIAAAAGMTPSMAHGYLVSLMRTGFVAQDRLSGLYDLGDAALQLGLASLSRTDFLSLARAAISQLAAELGETVTLAVWNGDAPVVVDKIEGRSDSVYEIKVGSLVRLWPTATGRVFMANLPDLEWEHHLRAIMHQGGEAETSIARFITELATVRSEGYAATLPSTVPDFSAVAAPVFDHRSHLKAVVTVLGRQDGFDIAPSALPLTATLRTARSLSLRLGASVS
ncbi:IclR family transcriptional regulator [Neorhizobium galegae]|uniref:IclR family transcriptional regulator n=1 Tax=Neorhizobium galegae TaxID=399 RepID=UPI000622A85D|nr:IclR family transcriptional regulator [Neorhizobium galegae]CDZ60369.1 Transcriptional regulator, IclR family [Neorhizobium galegae bv. orientalis]MCQ1574466.1 IclR family transcriptional regulator [Neorhizobium galegae]MCQ1810361.1 IclR family transcriptional regulator [Neorhizobium galegae]CDZ64529.1 Transcriptional regulator, IclR family [Neorhizobium galegae bv. orientalis]CDZ71888.1 Transcriptional regulator, IclR family [Neorhizobium galegae bv. orientalis]